MIILQRGVNGNNKKARVQCPGCDTINENADYYKALKSKQCVKCTLVERNKSKKMRELNSKEVDKTVSEFNSEENGLYIIKFTDKRHKCLVRCKHCRDEYEVDYKPDIYDRYGCVSCVRKSKTGTALMNRSVNHKHRLHRIFNNMKARTGEFTELSSQQNYEHIFICQEWLDDVENFYSWALANGYSDELSLDRKDNNLDYSPSNCRWTTKEVQARNTRLIRSTNTSGYRGVSLTIDKFYWRSRITVSNKEILIGIFETPIEAAYAYDNYILENNLEHTRNFNNLLKYLK